MPFVVFLIFMLLALPINASEKANAWKVRNSNKCEVDGGLYFWNSKKCLFKDNSAYIDGAWVNLNLKDSKVLYQAKKGKPSVNDTSLYEYEGIGVTLLLHLTLLPSTCNYSDDQCTVYLYKATFEVHRPNMRTLYYSGFAQDGA